MVGLRNISTTEKHWITCSKLVKMIIFMLYEFHHNEGIFLILKNIIITFFSLAITYNLFPYTYFFILT